MRYAAIVALAAALTLTALNDVAWEAMDLLPDGGSLATGQTHAGARVAAFSMRLESNSNRPPRKVARPVKLATAAGKPNGTLDDAGYPAARRRSGPVQPAEYVAPSEDEDAPELPSAAIGEAPGSLGSSPAAPGATLPASDAVSRAEPVAETFRTLCVRLCDGGFVQMSFATTPDHFKDDAARCTRHCATPARLFIYPTNSGRLETMRDLDGRPYREMPNAFAFRTAYHADCSCRQGKPLEAHVPAPADDQAGSANEPGSGETIIANLAVADPEKLEPRAGETDAGPLPAAAPTPPSQAVPPPAIPAQTNRSPANTPPADQTPAEPMPTATTHEPRSAPAPYVGARHWRSHGRSGHDTAVTHHAVPAGAVRPVVARALAAARPRSPHGVPVVVARRFRFAHPAPRAARLARLARPPRARLIAAAPRSKPHTLAHSGIGRRFNGYDWRMSSFEARL